MSALRSLPVRFSRFAEILLAAVPLPLAVVVYGYSLTLPFFLDDGPHFRILAQTNGLQQWGDFPAFPFYRPFVFTIWKAYGSWFGYDAVGMHALNLFTFGLCGVLVGQIARRASPDPYKRLIPMLAGCGFILFPFSYQAVAMVAALFHLVLALGLLLCLCLSVRWLDGHAGAPGLIGAWAAAFVALFSHENGVLTLPLLVGLALVVYGKITLSRRFWLLLLPIAGLTLLYLALWWSFRANTNTLSTDFGASLAALMQGMIYPFAALLRPLFTGDLHPALLLCLAAFILSTALLSLWQAVGQIRRAALYGMGWYVLAILPAVLFLPAGYVLGQMRLSLLASVGSSIFWGLIIARLLTPKQQQNLRPVRLIVAIALIGLFGYVSLEFLHMRRADFHLLRDYNRAALSIFAERNVIEDGAVLVNAPDYVFPDENDRRFLLGTEGVLFVDETLDYNQQFWMNSDVDYDNVEVIGYRQIQRNQGFGYRAHPPDLETAQVAEAVGDASHVFVTIFNGRRYWPEYVGGNALSGPDEPLVVYPETDFALTAGDADFDGATLRVRLRWQVNAPAGVKTFVHVYCDEQMIAQSDGYPWGDTYPFAFWQRGEIQTDVRTLHITASPGCLRIYAGLYREDTLARLEAVNHATGERLPDDLYPVELISVTDP
ncbi:MAG: hypothetical protein SF029_22115 [bacterium]|nr:hypothetical protein [bacterium]